MRIRKLLIAIFFILFIPVVVNAATLSSEQVALIESANAYYGRGKNVQYCGFRSTMVMSPEDMTSQDNKYLSCSVFVTNVYEDALNIKLQRHSRLLAAYAYHNRNNADVIRFWDTDDISEIKRNYTTADYLDFMQNVFTTDLKVGDIFIIIYNGATDNGTTYNWVHTMLISDIVYSNGKVSKVEILEANEDAENDSTKLSNGLSYSEEGSIKRNDIQDRVKKFLLSGTHHGYAMILRPTVYGNKKYVKPNCDLIPSGDPERVDSNLNNMENYKCTTSIESYDITPTANSRVKYSNMNIDKTITSNRNSINNSDVVMGEEIIYKIKITNGSNSNYNNLKIYENISKYVEVIDNGGGSLSGDKLSWAINVPANSSKTITYKVKVIANSSNVGKKVISTGYVDNIKNATITNLITRKLKNEQKNNIVESYNRLKSISTRKSKEFINEVYLDALDIDLKLNSLVLSDLISNNQKSNNPTSLSINKNNTYSSIILGGYYNGLKWNGTGVNGYPNASYNTPVLKYWEDTWIMNSPKTTLFETQGIIRSPRMDTIYNEHFDTGDILIYVNNNDTPRNENGEYAFIYIDGAFRGLNQGNINVFDSSNLANGSSKLNSLLGKDCYVILRPSYNINKVAAKTPVVTNYEGIYDGKAHTVSVESVTDGTLYYSLNQQDWSLTAPKRVDVGTTTLYLKVVGDEYHDDSSIKKATITIKDYDYVINKYGVDNANNYITKIPVNTDIDTFTSNISIGPDYSLTINYATVNKVKLLYTGGKTKIMRETTVYKEFTNAVTGDLNGDGVTNSADLLKTRQHLLNIKKLTGVYFISSDINNDGVIDSLDLLRIRQHLLGIKKIS